MRALGFVLLLLLWVVMVYAGYVLFGWWMVAFATLGAMWTYFKFKARQEAARKAAQADGKS